MPNNPTNQPTNQLIPTNWFSENSFQVMFWRQVCSDLNQDICKSLKNKKYSTQGGSNQFFYV